MEQALETGILDNVSDGTTLLLDNEYAWWHTDLRPYSWARTQGEYFYYLHSGKMIRTVMRTPDGNELSTRVGPGRGVLYEVRDVCDDHGTYVLLMRRNDPSDPLTNDVRIFVRDRDEPMMFLVKGRCLRDDAETDLLLGPSDLAVVRRGPSGTVYTLPPTRGPLLADSLTLFTFPARSVVGVTYHAGFYDEEYRSKQSWRWCSGHGTIALINSSPQARNVRFRIALAADREKEVRLKGGPLDEVIRVPAAGVQIDREVRLDSGILEVQLLCDGPPVPSAPDPRRLVFRIANLEIVETP